MQTQVEFIRAVMAEDNEEDSEDMSSPDDDEDEDEDDDSDLTAATAQAATRPLFRECSLKNPYF